MLYIKIRVKFRKDNMHTIMNEMLIVTLPQHLLKNTRAKNNDKNSEFITNAC